ncbi:nitrous oxide-stimulated promoter family protein [uncultured Bacteroides sp.]|uniref:nitrous oxide-stimulated promoter family protein n=1 Tax=uncultured Bacteroides sp. TaxID=162156 RepID=UPI00280A89C7|nr:nitrous oxide-stimulated promoter family protein [uncultured Bacteroides sp.]
MDDKTIEQMIRLYCRRKEGNRELCPQCSALLEYTRARLSHCPFGKEKPTCRLCTIHCYRPEMRKRIRAVMQYAGPLMIFYHPVAALRHLWKECRPYSKRKR